MAATPNDLQQHDDLDAGVDDQDDDDVVDGTIAPPPSSRPSTLAEDQYGLWRGFLDHEWQWGGTLGLWTGRQGCGKTTAQLWAARHLVQRGEVVLWRGREVDAWTRYPGDVKVWSTYPLRFTKLQLGQPDGERIDMPYTRVESRVDVLEKSKPGVLNVVYLKEREIQLGKRKGGEQRAVWKNTHAWADVIHDLAHKDSAVWHALFIDELHDVLPSYAGGDDWHVYKDVAGDLADFRKRYSSIYGGTHYYNSIYQEALEKFQYFLWMKGSRLPQWSAIMNKGLCGTLPRGSALLEDRGNFVQVSFPKLVDIDHQLRVDEDLDASAVEDFERTRRRA